MDWIIDNIKAFIENVRERIKNPFTERNAAPFAGAFILAFIVYNWRLVFTLLSFDSNETRLSKIKILECLLAQEPWYIRIGYPIVLAFVSITFFYVFSITSLGLTTFFNRWFKGIVLQLFDQGKLVSREEFDKLNARYNNNKRSYEKSKDDLVKLEDEKATIDKQLADLNSKYTEVIEENEKLKKVNESNPKIDNTQLLKILYAEYGSEEIYRDVTETVKNLLAGNSSFEVNNKTLEGDPLPYSIKQLKVVYESGGNRKSITFNERELVTLEGNDLKSSETESSKLKQNYLNNIAKLAVILAGNWELKFTSRDGVQDTEPIIVDNTGKYFAHAKLRFYLRTVMIDEANKKITFNKVDPNRKLHSKESLNIQNEDLITGTDSLGYRLEYKRKQ